MQNYQSISCPILFSRVLVPAYLLPLFERLLSGHVAEGFPVALVVAPSQELSRQIAEVFNVIGAKYSLNAHVLQRG